MNKSKAVLSKKDISTLKSARKILKRLTDKADEWDKKLSKLYNGDDPDKAIYEQMKYNSWLDCLDQAANVNFRYKTASLDGD